MFVRTAGRWACIFAFVSGAAVVAVSCGGASNGSVFNGEPDGSADATSSSSSGSGGGSGSGGHVPDGGLTGGGDGGVGCTPKTCAQLGYDCGANNDGCGNVIMCGSCSKPEYCGGGGYSKCGGGMGLGSDGGAQCKPLTCTGLGYDCGPAGDGCGGLLQCGTCTAPSFCGGGGYSKCGTGGGGGGNTCDSGMTTLTGYVYDPANNLPVYNALVYVPVGAVQTPQTGVNPPQCGCTAQPAYASAFTGIDGKFTLANPPSGSNVTVVVELGKWQRVFQENITACQPNTLASHLTLPSTHAEGNIPLFAMDTGTVDSLECVLRKMGIADSEFVAPNIVAGKPTAAERVHIYQGSVVAGGAMAPAASGTTPNELALVDTQSVMNSYDAVLFACQGGPGTYDAAALSNLVTFANDGGRAFTTHYHYDLVDQPSTWAATANWAPDSAYTGADPTTGYIDMSFMRGQVLASWLAQPIVVGGTLGQIAVNTIRYDFNSVNAPAQRWMYLQAPDPPNPLHFTFDTPFNKSPTCGRVVYSDFHVEDNVVSTTTQFPGECTNATMTPQEKLLEFMLLDLTSCVSPPTCKPLTCGDFPQGTCGPQGDGCGGSTADCGMCTPPQTCGGGGKPGMCGYPDAGTCVPTTCQKLGIQCGPAGDGCGGLLQCGTCQAPQTCGGGGTPGKCGGSGSQ
ncbi:MAG TPA: hypothetical protein VF765_18555 [Polyangiaceae bacterium]